MRRDGRFAGATRLLPCRSAGRRRYHKPCGSCKGQAAPLPPVPGRMAPTGNFWGPGVPTWGGGVSANLQPARVRSESQTVARPGEWNAVGGSCQPSLRPPRSLRVNLPPALKLGPSCAGCVLIDCWLCLLRVAVAAATDLGMDGAIGWYGPGSSRPPLDASTAAALVRQAQALTARCAALAPRSRQAAPPAAELRLAAAAAGPANQATGTPLSIFSHS